MPTFLPMPPEPGGAHAETLAAFVPPLVRERIARTAGPIEQAAVEEYDGAVLLTDINGFTPLTERLDASGPEGVERLSRQLNAYFTRLIGIIESHGGVVAKFAGDALLAVWRSEVERATPCAAAIRSTQAQGASAWELGLSVKVAVGTGRIAHGFFGGDGRTLSMLGGPAMAAARRAIRQPFTEAASAAPPAIFTHTAECLPPALLSPHVPGPVREQLAAGHTAWLAEFRQVTVLFAHAPGVAFDNCTDVTPVRQVCAAVQEEIARFGGTLDDVGEDHEGVVIVGAFGLPGATHEDDAARAVRAARALHERLRAVDPRVAIGLSTGRLFCGSIGSEAVRSYSMVGDAMNRCARLMTLAVGDVFCDDATREQASRRHGFEFVRHSVLAGRRATVAIHRPLLATGTAAPAQGMIGRAADREWLRERLAADRGGPLIVEGEAGIGKTTLLAELRALCATAGIPQAGGGGDAIDAASTYHAWVPVLREVLGIAADASAAARATAVFAALQECLPADADLAPLLNPVTSTAFPENDTTRHMTAQARSEELARLVAALLRRFTGDAPLLVVMEDCHWLDSASLSLALALLRRLPRLLLALATRPWTGEPPEEWRALCAAAAGDHRVLGPLEEADVAALTRRRLGAERVEPAVAEFIAEGGRGNPFFCEELCHSLRDSGQVVIERGLCRLVRGGAVRRLAPAGTVQSVVAARIDRLSARERLAMKVASVGGRRFTLRMLSQVHPVEEDRPHLRECLDRLVSLDFAVRLGEADGFEFKHAIVQEVAYQQLVFAQRQELHRRVAEWMEAGERGDAALLAHHWGEAAVPQRALHYLDRAGDEACRRYANREAAELLDRAITLAAASGVSVKRATLGRWWRQRGEARFHMGRVVESVSDLGEAVRILGWPMPAPWRLRAWDLPAEIARQLARRTLHRWPAPFTGPRRGELTEAIHAFHLLSEAAFFQHDMPASAYCVFRGANLAEQLGAPSALVGPYCGMMLMTGILSRRGGEACLRLADRAAEESDTPTARAYAGMVSAIFLGGHGEEARVRERIEEAAAIFRRYGDGRRVEESLINLIYPLLYQGRYAECARLLGEMSDSAEQRGDTQTLGWVRLIRAQVLLPTQGAGAVLEALGGDYDAGLDALTSTAMHATAAVAHWRLGDAEQARKWGAIALARNEARPPLAHVMLLYIGYLAEVFLGLLAASPSGGTALHRPAIDARTACRRMRRFARIFPVARSRAALWSGLQQWIAGQQTAAGRAWREAIDLAQRHSLQPDIARAHAWLAAVEDGAHREEAVAICARSGALAELDRYEADLHNPARTRRKETP